MIKIGEEYLFDKELYELLMENNDNYSYVAGIEGDNGKIIYIRETVSKDLKECIQIQLKLMQEHNVIVPMYVTICKYDGEQNIFISNDSPMVEVKYCANCFRQVDADDLDNIEIIDGMCFHKKDC